MRSTAVESLRISVMRLLTGILSEKSSRPMRSVLAAIRATERELVPNKGAQLGNFAVVDVNEHETWVTTSEGMRPGVSEKYGANGRVYAARILWDKPNTVWNKH